MKDLTKLTEQIIEETRDLTQLMVRKTMNVEDLMSVDTEEFEILKRCYTLMDNTCKLAVKQAEVIDGIDEKLNKVLVELTKMKGKA